MGGRMSSIETACAADTARDIGKTCEGRVHRDRVRVVAGQVHREAVGREAPVGPDGDAHDLRRVGGVDDGEDRVQGLALRLVVLDFEVRQEERGGGVRADVATGGVGRGDGARDGGGGGRGEEEKRDQCEGAPHPGASRLSLSPLAGRGCCERSEERVRGRKLHLVTPPAIGFVQPFPMAVASYSTPYRPSACILITIQFWLGRATENGLDALTPARLSSSRNIHPETVP